MIFGKLFGLFFGYLFLGPAGSVFGLILGHAFDKGLTQNMHTARPSTVEIQSVFFEATFSMMGFLAKSDGRVNEQEIAAAREIMANMQLSPEQQREAIAFFQKGKGKKFDFHLLLRQLEKECRQHFQLKQLFLEIQIQAVLVDGEIHPNEYHILCQIARGLKIAKIEIDTIIARIEAMHLFSTGRTRQSGSKRQYQQARQKTHRTHQTHRETPQELPRNLIQEAYQILGVKEHVSDVELKKAYRRLMSEHHPDKLVSKGLPLTMMKMATEKTQKIQEAYDRLVKHRGA